MASVISFREASEKARSDARSALTRLREERLKSRQEARPRWAPSPAPQEVAAPEPAPVAHAASTTIISEPVQAVQPEAVSPPPTPKRKGGQSSTGRGKRIADIVRNATSERPTEAEAETVVAEAKAEPAEIASEQPESPPDTAPSMALSMLSVLGPGLRWRLSQLGIDNLKSLSKADAASLRRELGEIGKLANVEAWIEAARAIDKPGA